MVQAHQEDKSHLIMYAFIGFISGFTMLVLPFFWLLIKNTIKFLGNRKDTPINMPFGGGNNLGD